MEKFMKKSSAGEIMMNKTHTKTERARERDTQERKSNWKKKQQIYFDCQIAE